MSISLPDALSISRALAMSPQRGWLTSSWENHLLTCTEAAITQPLPLQGKKGLGSISDNLNLKTSQHFS